MVNADELVDVEAPKEQDEVKPTNPGTQEAPKSNVENDKEDAACANPKDAPEVADNADMAQNCAGKDPKSDEGNTEDYPNDEFDVEAPRKQEAMDLSPSLAASNDKANESLDYGSVEGGKAIEIMTPGSPGDTEHDVSFESTEGTIELPSPSSQPKRRSRKTFYLVAFLMVLLIGCALAVVFGTGLVDGEDSSTPSAGSQGDTGDAEPTSPPTTGGDTDSPPTSGTDTPAQTEPPTDPPTDPLLGTLMTFSKTGLDDPTSPQCQAYQWLATEDTLTDKSTDSARLQQRYALATMLFSVGGKLHMDAQEHECDWPGVMCAANSAYNTTAEEWQVTELNMTSQVCSNYAVGCQSVELAGTIPPEIGLLAPSLVRVDISSNPYLHGSIPDEFYDLSELEYMYLENNALTGQLSEDIGKLTLLSALYVGSNKLTGPIPYNLGARQGASRLRYLSLYDNKMDGPIPEVMNLRSAFYIDLSHNQFSGTLPADWGEDFPEVRHVYLDHNQFDGVIPESYSHMGGDRLMDLTLDNNKLEGSVPSDWQTGNIFLDTFTVHNNSLTANMPDALCKLSVLEGGEMVELGADCEICSCKTLCDGYCY